MMEELFSIERILGFCEKVCYFFIINLLFVISNVPALLFLLFVGGSRIHTYLPLFLLSMLPIAPALSAVMYTMNRMIQGTEGKAFRDYKKGYKRDFLQKAVLGAGQLVFIFILWTNAEFFAVRIKILPLAVISGMLLAVTVIITPNLYMLISRYEMKNMQIVRTALVLLITRPVATLGNIAALLLMMMFYEIAAGTAVLFMGSIYGFLVMFMNQRLMKSLESR